MRKYHKYIEYAYLIVALFFTEETIRNWKGDETSYLFIALAVMALFMFFFKRWFRKKLEGENSNG